MLRDTQRLYERRAKGGVEQQKLVALLRDLLLLARTTPDRDRGISGLFGD